MYFYSKSGKRIFESEWINRHITKIGNITRYTKKVISPNVHWVKDRMVWNTSEALQNSVRNVNHILKRQEYTTAKLFIQQVTLLFLDGLA